VAVTARPAAIVAAAVNFLLGLAFVHSGAAAWVWERVERDVPWRTGPTAVGAFVYFAIYWGACVVANVALRGEVARSASFAARALVASCVLLAIQVLVPQYWLIIALVMLLLAMIVNAYTIREPFARTLTAWAWSGAGLALATLLVHAWFVGQPLFIVRLAVVMTLWDFLGERLGVSRRLTRLVPSLYFGSGRTADQARVAR
jgi:hypothetical protein